MNEKEVAELRRRIRPDHNAITHIHGCYVNEKGEIVARFDQPMSMLSQEETERMLGLLRKTLSGGLGKNLTDITFATRQVVEGEEHKLLMTLRDSELRDEEAVENLFHTVIRVLQMEGNYLILLASDRYDVPFRGKDDAVLKDDASGEVYSYILCAVCPVKQTKPGLSYYVNENEFHSLSADWVVAAPELGFLFPAFDERSTNLYNALYYSRDTAENHPEFVDAVFRAQPPMAPAAQKETFQGLLHDVLEEDCCMDVVQAVQDRLCTMVDEHKQSKDPRPLTVSKNTVKNVLSTCGVSDEKVVAFGDQYDARFGEDADLSPRNLVDINRMEIKTPDVTIRVSAERSDLLQTRVIDGAKYILIRAEEGVEVNGVPVHIS